MDLLMNESILGPLGAFGASVTWAWASVGYARVAQNHSAFAVNFARAAIGLSLWILATLLTTGISSYSQATLSHVGWFSLSAVASYGFADALFLFSTRSLGVPGALAVTATYPLWTSLFGLLFKNEYLTLTQICGLFLTIIAVVVVVLTTPQRKEKQAGKKISVGLFLAIATSLLWALNGYAIANAGAGIVVPVANSLRMACALAMTTVCGKILMPRTSLFIPKNHLKPEIKYFVIETFFGSMFFTYGLSHTPLALGATLSSLAPVVSVPLAWMSGVEKISLPRTLGIIGVVVGLALLVQL